MAYTASWYRMSKLSEEDAQDIAYSYPHPIERGSRERFVVDKQALY